MPPGSFGKAAQLQISHADAMEVDHPVAHFFHHPADLPVFALHQNDAKAIVGQAI